MRVFVAAFLSSFLLTGCISVDKQIWKEADAYQKQQGNAGHDLLLETIDDPIRKRELEMSHQKWLDLIEEGLK